MSEANPKSEAWERSGLPLRKFADDIQRGLARECFAMGYDAAPTQCQWNREEAVAFAQSGKWKTLTHRERAILGLMQNRMCMDFAAFHESLEKAMDRPVWTHELADPKALLNEMFGLGPKAETTFEDVLAKIPEDKETITVLAGPRPE